MNTAPNIIEGTDGALSQLVQAALQAASENIASLIDKPISIETGEVTFLNAEIFVTEREGKFVLLSGDLEKDYEGTVHTVMGQTEAITLSSYMMMVPEEVVNQNRTDESFAEDAQETFGEVGNIIFSALDEVLRDQAPGQVSIRVKDQELYELPGKAPRSFTEGPFIQYAFNYRIADYEEAVGALLLPLEAAEKINGEPLNFGEEVATLRAQALRQLEQGPEDEIEDIEQAPIQARLATYVQHGMLFKKVRKSCRRIGLELEKRPKTEVPNPSAHLGKVVLIEIGRGDLKRFDWCRRLKESGDIQVVIMLMDPTDYHVVLAFKAGADVIMGWPIHERRLSSKMATLFEEEGASETRDTASASA
jgi:chemotaxis protein CheY-P-specific phosphatase CheC